jgi:hypothetical protein
MSGRVNEKYRYMVQMVLGLDNVLLKFGLVLMLV